MKSRRGLCRCGAVLEFLRGPDGYKTRCSSCGSVVRLKSPRKKRRGPRPAGSPSLPLLDPGQVAILEQVEAPPVPMRQGPRTGDLQPASSLVEMAPWDGTVEGVSSGWLWLVVPVVAGALLVMGGMVGLAYWLLH